jgi:hypothetical protein
VDTTPLVTPAEPRRENKGKGRGGDGGGDGDGDKKDGN